MPFFIMQQRQQLVNMEIKLIHKLLVHCGLIKESAPVQTEDSLKHEVSIGLSELTKMEKHIMENFFAQLLVMLEQKAFEYAMQVAASKATEINGAIASGITKASDAIHAQYLGNTVTPQVAPATEPTLSTQPGNVDVVNGEQNAN